jgi:hypothetical protein
MTPRCDDGEWLPLGVFAMTHDNHPKADLILQLAVNKEGTIRGNYTATLVDHTLPVQGSVDKKTQRDIMREVCRDSGGRACR